MKIANSAEVDAVWPLIGERFNEAFRRCGDDLTGGELWQLCRSGNAFLILNVAEEINLACIVRFERWADGTVLRVLSLVGDDVNSWADAISEFLTEMACLGGSSRIVADGRGGWERIFSKPKVLRRTYMMEI